MRVMVFGLRGFPSLNDGLEIHSEKALHSQPRKNRSIGKMGGVETHAEKLYRLLVDLGCEVEVIVRSPYWSSRNPKKWQGVNLHPLWAPVFSFKGLEAWAHSFLSVCYALIRRPEVLHIHGLGPSLMAPLARLFGLHVVVTNHGPDYESEKWGRFGRIALLAGEYFGARYAHRYIVISNVIREIVKKKYDCLADLIPNGVDVEELPQTQSALKRFGLKPRRYILLVSRLVSHKRHPDLIKAFKDADLPDWKLVLVGGTDSDSEYSRSVLSLAAETRNVVLTGHQIGLPLKELYANAGLFVLPSSYEGLPIAILEALSYGLTVIASDIAAHIEIGLPPEQYFPLGDSSALSRKLCEFSSIEFDENKQRNLRAWLQKRYDWRKIAEQTFAVYSDLN